ncbi:MAG: hydrogenobyrinic acid a,c-diamide synthase (glutamine-hydrolyzing) [Thermodesulfobacteria bacterium]|nr:hydrogenobyrinic acid a,c-diamide synthase (glutamine-hydrolyzing) [Thermodesulfobacteriota bacterium]
MDMNYQIPRILISSHKGGAGKTLFTVGLIALLKDQGLKVSAFKKGPDYIDAGWLSRVSGVPCRNLDLFLFGEEENLYSFFLGSRNKDIAIIEGNRGLFDGMDEHGSCSTAKLAKLLKAPIILVLDCTKVTRSLAALVKGFLEFEQGVEIKGVILNKIARPRHQKVITKAIETYTDAKVIGAVPKLKKLPPERHLGLVTSCEYKEWEFLEELKEHIKNSVNLEEVLKIAKSAVPIKILKKVEFEVKKRNEFRIGVFKDEAFQFYYPENLEVLEVLGAEIMWINSINTKRLPEVDGLYLGGGFPEVKGEELAENRDLAKDVKDAVLSGMPVYAECGGFMYLGKEVRWRGHNYPMTGVLPIIFEVKKRPQGHGYIIAKVKKENPYFKVGSIIKGHEFHYSKPLSIDENKEMEYIFELEKGFGIDGKRDGILYKNLFASYTHIHIFSVKCWAENFVRKIEEFKSKKT